MPCKAIGDPKPTILWYHDGIPIAPSDKVDINEKGVLSIADLDKDSDSGVYTCVASSKTGKSTWSAYLKVDLPTNPNLKFFRAPEQNTFPGQPGKPQIVEKSENGVTLSWIRSNKVGGSPVQGYIVEMFGRNDTDGWMKVAERVENTTYTQIGLIAGISYFFVVRAENSHGLSAPSPMSDTVIVGLVSNNMSC